MESETGVVHGLAVMELNVIADRETEAIAVVVPGDDIAETRAI